MVDFEAEGVWSVFSDEMQDWYVVRHQRKGTVMHRESLAERYPSEEEAEKAAAALRANS